MTVKKYHHGDLCQSLIEHATLIIREAGVDGLSMRKLADRVGVSRTAPYHHFKDKNALLCEIAESGFHQQDAIFDELAKTTPSKDSFAAYVSAYINFANDNPETYDLMFGKEIWKLGKPSDSLKQTSKLSFQKWLKWVEHLQQANVLDSHEPALQVAQTCWATMHGMCRLLNDGIYAHKQGLEAMVNTASKLLLNQK